MNTEAASERQAWAVDQLGIEAATRLLEVGCGHGVALSLAAALLGREGRIVGIDRSEKMIAAAARRNARHIDAGRVTLRRAAYPDHGQDAGSQDIVFALHVADFWRRADIFLPATAALLREGGRLWLFTQPPSSVADAAARWAEATKGVLAEHGWREIEIRRGSLASGPTAAVAAVAPAR